MNGVIRKSAKVIVLLLLVVAVLLFFSRLVIVGLQKSSIKSPGQAVFINGKKMYVFSQGAGNKNIILMSGLGTGSPYYDFKPLSDSLSKKYRTVTVENFGYGWSDCTRVKRSVDNIIEETRTALREAHTEPPYNLVVHSISGIYAMYYADKYPDEVRSIIGLDSSVPNQAKIKRSGSKLKTLQSIYHYTGVYSIEYLFRPMMFEETSSEYSDNEKREYGIISSWNIGNKNLVDESNLFLSNEMKVNDIILSSSIKLGFILSSKTINETRKYDFDWVNEHKKLGTNPEIFILEGDHYIHHGNVDKVCEIIDRIVM